MSHHIQSVTVNEHGIVQNPTVLQGIEGFDAASQLLKAQGESTIQLTDFRFEGDATTTGTDQLHYLASVASMDTGHMTSVTDSTSMSHHTAGVVVHPTTRYHIDTVKVLKRTKEEVAAGKLMYQCSACDRESNYTSNLYKHMKTQHSNFVVEKLVEPEKRNLLNTPPTKETNSTIYLKCSTCSKIFESVNEMREHLKSHDPKNNVSPVKQSFQQTFVDHIDSYDDDDDDDNNDDTNNDNAPDELQGGDIVYVVKTSKRGIELGKPPYSCSVCGKTAELTGNLYKHMTAIHPHHRIQKLINPRGRRATYFYPHRKKQYQPRDPKTFFTPSSNVSGPVVKVIRASKEEINRGMKPYSCSICGKESEMTGNLYKHMESHHPDHTVIRLQIRRYTRAPAEPIELNRYSSTNNSKTVYAIKATDEEICNGAKPYRCSECGKESEFTSNLYAHMDKQHTDCVVQTLKNKFNQRAVQPNPATLTRGNTTVTVVETAPDHMGRKYKCSRCYLTTTSTGSLYKHMRRMHKGFAIIKKQQPGKKTYRNEAKRRYTRRRTARSDFFDDYEDNDNDNGHSDNWSEEELEEEDVPTVSEDITFKSFECCICEDMKAFRTIEELDSHISTEHSEGNETMNDNDEIIADNDSDDQMFSDDEEEDPQTKQVENDSSEVEVSPAVADGVRRSNRRRKCKSVWVVKNSKEDIKKGKNPYECSECGKGAKHTGNLYYHMKTHHINYEIFKLDENHASHIKSAAQRNPDPGTGKIVTIVKSSKFEISRGKRPYKCSRCEYTGSTTGNLYRHMRFDHRDCEILRLSDK